MKIYISADIEGVAGVVSREQLGPAGFDYESARQLMTNEVKAAMKGAKKSGATDFVVSDSHGNGQNLILREFGEDTTIVRSWPRDLSMMAGIEQGEFAGVFFIGYHSGVDNPRGCLAHTMNSRVLSSIKVNGTPACEAFINAAIAGYFQVPILLATGDDAFLEEIKDTVSPVQTVLTKWSLGTTSARCKPPQTVLSEIEEAAAQAVRKKDRHPAFQLTTPLSVELAFTQRIAVELLATLDEFKRTGALSIRFEAKNAVDLSRKLDFLLTYRPDLGL